MNNKEKLNTGNKNKENIKVDTNSDVANNNGNTNKLSTDSLPACILFASVFFIFCPLETMLQNSGEYTMSLWMFLLPHSIVFVFTVLVLYMLCMRLLKDTLPLPALLTGISVAAYAQRMFMNGRLQELNGDSALWRDDKALLVINIIIWLLIIMSVMLLILKTKPGRKILVYLPSFLILIQLVGLISLMLTAPKEVYIVDYTKYDYSGEFDVAPGKNTIILVFDAVDNTYIKSLYNDNSELFEDFNDFTLYTNTCSVYDHTHFSLPQMMTGCGFNGEELADYNEFYERLHNNGYEVDYYFYEMDRTLPDIRNYIDNCSIEEPAKDMLEVDYQDIFLQSAAMSWYQTMPYAAKMFVNAEELSFNKQLIIKGAESEGIYGNEEFLSALDLNINDRTDNRLTMIHLNGAHYNWDESNEYMSMTVTCLDIAAEYIRQLKKLGLYDDATIILTADHGLHETLHNVCEPATPMLMIKNAGAHGEAMAVTDAPVYHTDFPKTILIGAGLYNETADGDRFGFSFYDFEESDERVRTWYDYDEGNFYAFTYSGDTSDLENCVNNMDCEVIPYE